MALQWRTIDRFGRRCPRRVSSARSAPNGAPLVAGALLGPEAVPPAAGLACLLQVGSGAAQSAERRRREEQARPSRGSRSHRQRMASPPPARASSLCCIEVQHGRAAAAAERCDGRRAYAPYPGRTPHARIVRPSCADVLRFTVRNESNVTTGATVHRQLPCGVHISQVCMHGRGATALTGMPIEPPKGRVDGHDPTRWGARLTWRWSSATRACSTWLEPATGDLISSGLVASLPAGGDLRAEMRQLRLHRCRAPGTRCRLPRFQDTGASHSPSHYRPLPCIPMGSRVALLSERTGKWSAVGLNTFWGV